MIFSYFSFSLYTILLYYNPLGLMGLTGSSVKSFNFYSEPTSEQEILDRCEDKNLKRTFNCFKNNIETFYLYNETDDSIETDFDYLKEFGGDCKDWTDIYSRLCNETNYYCRTVNILNSAKIGHALLLVSDETGYCLVDQLNIWCAVNE